MRLKRLDYSNNMIKEMNTENLSNFYDRSKRELLDFWDIFQYNKEIDDELLDVKNDSPFRVLLLETLYSYRISLESCLMYQTFLLDRIKAIENIIDSHFALIIPTLTQKLRDSFERDRKKRKRENKEGTLKDQVAQRKYEEWFFKYSPEIQFENPLCYTHKRKIKLLVEFQDELIQADKDREDNKQGIPDICRMTGSLTQSYFIFDAVQFKVGRKIYYGMANDDPPADLDIKLSTDSESQSSSSSSSASSLSVKKSKKSVSHKSRK